jgi:hypothetical protein
LKKVILLLPFHSDVILQIINTRQCRQNNSTAEL